MKNQYFKSLEQMEKYIKREARRYHGKPCSKCGAAGGLTHVVTAPLPDDHDRLGTVILHNCDDCWEEFNHIIGGGLGDGFNYPVSD